ncbi:hypothetical protein AVEN_47939-1 [Araneus ventricosus]|uniref:Uncharacterized protein n=1 Tax=Araneus ventricosus TaxID=182803 RepID=A0A4Y2DRA1_ARAVE|nr:hypothetical protein AVEN_47939-1 [Araneus ventricosus]
MIANKSTSWGDRMDEETPITEITDIATDDAATCAKLRRQTNLIKELTTNITNASRLEIDLMHDPDIHAGLIENMAHWQKELNSLESEASKLYCPVVNCAHHKTDLSKTQFKGSLSSVSDETSNSTHLPNSKIANEKPLTFFKEF